MIVESISLTNTFKGDESTAKSRQVYHVTPGANGGWDVKAEDNKRPSGHFNTKLNAVSRGKELAKKAALG
jgi:hypothetical protein